MPSAVDRFLNRQGESLTCPIYKNDYEHDINFWSLSGLKSLLIVFGSSKACSEQSLLDFHQCQWPPDKFNVREVENEVLLTM